MESRQSTNVGHRKVLTTPQLSCELCRERKVKCDKLDPCTSCVSAGVACVPIRRPRLPRGRHVHRSRRTSQGISTPHQGGQSAGSGNGGGGAVDEDIRRRIYRLESLVESMSSATARVDTPSQGLRGLLEQSGQTPPNFDGSQPHFTALPARPMSPSPALSRGSKQSSHSVHLPDPFWTDLVEEVHGLRSIIDPVLSETDEDDVETTDVTQTDAIDGGIKALGLSRAENSPSIQRSFTPEISGLSPHKETAKLLCQVYLTQVDPIIKILHRLSLDKWILQEGGYIGYPDGHVSIEALRAAIFYSAVGSMTEDQCQEMFHITKTDVMADYRRQCEAAIERSCLLSTEDITVLQAFVLYLIARRTEHRTKDIWTLTAVAVRIAKGLRLDQTPDEASGRTESFFNQQMRRRLWFTICLVDMQASLGQASEPLIGPEEIISSLPLPRHINDSDFDPSTTQPVPDREELTDTTFSLVTYHLQVAGRLICFASPAKGDGEGDKRSRDTTAASSERHEKQQQHVRSFQQEALDLLRFCDPESSPYAWLTWHGTQCLVSGSRAVALRPFFSNRARRGGRAAAAAATTPTPRGRVADDTELLRLTLQVLEKAMLIHTDPRGRGFRWYMAIPLLLLAMAVTECYICTDAALVRRAWPVLEASYSHYEAGNAWYSSARLRGPLKKLMQSTREKVAPVLENSSGGGGGVGSVGVSGGPSSSDAGGVSFQSSGTVLPKPNAAFNEEPAGSTQPTNMLSSSFGLTFGPAYAAPAPHASQQIWGPTVPIWDNQLSLSAGMPTAFVPPSQEELDQASGMWEEFLSSMSFENSAGLDMYFPGDDLGSH